MNGRFSVAVYMWHIVIYHKDGSPNIQAFAFAQYQIQRDYQNNCDTYN